MSIQGRSRRLPGVRVRSLDAAADDGVHDVWYGTASVVVKRDHENLATVVNEFICTRLAVGLGLPVPMGDAAVLDESSAYVSAQVDIEGQLLPDPDLSQLPVVAAHDLAGIAVFDAWINNHDRSEQNVLYHPKVGLWAIDHEQALGSEVTLDPARLIDRVREVPPWRLSAGRDLNAEHLLEWTLAVRSTGVRHLRAATREAQARRLITGAQASAIEEYLSYRRSMIDHLVAKSIGEENVPWLAEPPRGT